MHRLQLNRQAIGSRFANNQDLPNAMTAVEATEKWACTVSDIRSSGRLCHHRRRALRGSGLALALSRKRNDTE